MRVRPPFDDTFKLWLMLHQTTDAMLAVRQKELDKQGVSVIEAGVLLFTQAIEQTGDRTATVAELSRWLFRKRNSISELISRMETRGLVTRPDDPGRKKGRRITLTEKGQLICREVGKVHLVDRIINSLSDDERQHLWSTLGKLRGKAFRELAISKKPPIPRFP